MVHKKFKLKDGRTVTLDFPKEKDLPELVPDGTHTHNIIMTLWLEKR